MTLTYDPILEVRRLARVRIFSPVPSPRRGTALVLEAVGREPLVIHAGERVPEPRLGNYTTASLVDLTQYGLELDERLPSADRAFLHECRLTFTCAVRDPALVVERGIRDMTEAVRLSLVRIMRAVARSYDISQANTAEAALGAALEEFGGDAAISLGNYLVEIAVPGQDAERSSERYHDATRELRLERMSREEMSRVLATGREEVIAQWLAKHGRDPSALLEMEADAHDAESERVLRAVHLLSASGRADEPFDTREERKRLIGRLLPDSPALPASDPGGRGSRRARLAGSLSGSAADGAAERVDVSTSSEGPATAVPEGAEEAGRADPGPEPRVRNEAGGRGRVRSGRAPDTDAEAPDDRRPARSPAGREEDDRRGRGSRVRGLNLGDPPPSSRTRARNPDATGE